MTAEDVRKACDMVSSRGKDMFQASQFEAALGFYKLAYQLAPEQPDTLTNLAAVLVSLGRYDKARGYLKKALKIAPLHENANYNYAKALSCRRRFDEAQAIYDRMLAANPGNHRVRVDRGFNHLDQGHYEEGLVDYEYRLQVWPDKYQKMPVPLWQGEDLTDKALYVQGEQGIGDTILFLRFLAVIKHQYPSCRIFFCCAPDMLSFYWRYADICSLVPVGLPFNELGKLHYAAYLGSLPRLAGLKSPANIPPDPGFIDTRIELPRMDPKGRYALPRPEIPGNPIKVGIAWTGNPQMTENNKRSVPFPKMYHALAGERDLLLYSFQRDVGRSQMLAIHGEEVICDLYDYLPNMVQTGLAMKELDVMVTTCNVLAHLAGALNIPTILILGYAPYWVWGRTSETTKWYPNHMIFRQLTADEDWSEVMSRVRSKLFEMHARLRG